MGRTGVEDSAKNPQVEFSRCRHFLILLLIFVVNVMGED